MRGKTLVPCGIGLVSDHLAEIQVRAHAADTAHTRERGDSSEASPMIFNQTSGVKANTSNHKNRRSQIGGRQMLSAILLMAGILVLTFSIVYSSSTAALIGLGLIFWGGILFYVQTGELVKKSLFNTTVFPSLEALNHLIFELGFEGQAIYLPPKYLVDIESSRVFIAKDKGPCIPDLEQILAKNNSIFIDKPKGILLEPPGAEITRLIEHILETNFARTDLDFFEQKIPTVLVEDLEIAQDVRVERHGSKLEIVLENSSYAELCYEHSQLSKANISSGCPICSTLACIIAKAAGSPVIIGTEKTSKEKRTINASFTLLDQASRD